MLYRFGAGKQAENKRFVNKDGVCMRKIEHVIIGYYPPIVSGCRIFAGVRGYHWPFDCRLQARVKN
jgi:hypothetical protein